MSLLEGVRIVDFTAYAAGPACGRILADWKADVIKVEPLHGEPFRHWGRNMGAPIEPDENPMFEIDNANKRGIAVDLKTDEGQGIMRRLLEKADVFLTNYREKALARLRLDYETLSAAYPRLIYGYLSGFGSKGPLAAQPGFDLICFWSRGGFGGFLGEPGAEPVSPLPATGDQISGIYLAGGILAALYGRMRTGKGEKVEGSLYHSALWSAGLFNTASNYWENPKKSRHAPDSVLTNCFRSKDGVWFFVGVMEHEKYWPTVCGCIDRPDMADDERFLLYENARRNSREITAILDREFEKKTMDELERLFKAGDIPACRIFDAHDINRDEQAFANGFLRKVAMPNGHCVPLPTTPCIFAEEGELSYGPAPRIGEHTGEILAGLGYSEEEIKAFSENSVIAL